MANGKKQSDQISAFLAGLYGLRREEFEALGSQPEAPAEPPPGDLGAVAYMPAVMAPDNQPEFWADAPWRLEPDQEEIPVTIYIRDAAADPAGRCPWRLDALRVEQRLESGRWRKLRVFLPAHLPGVDGQGVIESSFWVFHTALPKSALQNAQPGGTAHLRVVFDGSMYPFTAAAPVERHLEVTFARHGLPQGRVERAGRPRHWFYGDTHYHSGYTNDLKEYGAPLPETRPAALAVGLDWLVVTDHSCDLVLPAYGAAGHTRWERLKAEVPALSDERFRFILGEEITLVGRGERYVHMLAIGGMRDVVPGAFLPEGSSSLVSDIFISALKFITSMGKGYAPEQIHSLFGRLHRFDDVLAMLPAGTLAFAAHPYDFAQVPPARWDERDLANPRLAGHEFWNGRSRRTARQTGNPFARKSWTDPAALERKDEQRIQKLFRLAGEKWDPHLVRGVEEWAPGAALPHRRPVFIAGSDAHGDFNYHAGMAWDYSKNDLIDDNVLGRVRTALYLPQHPSAQVPGVEEILAALKKGSCAVTDGPLLEFSLRCQGQLAHMGDALTVDGPGEPELHIAARTTPEFGPLARVEVVSYFKGQKPRVPSIVAVEAGQAVSLPLSGAQGYIRLQAQAAGPDGERFCCFTNPVWLRAKEYANKRLHVLFE